MRLHASLYSIACAALLHHLGSAVQTISNSAVHAGQPSPSSSPPPATGTCPFTSINYITHGLPQQCLGATRSPLTTATNSTSGSIEASITQTIDRPSSKTPISVSAINTTHTTLHTSYSAPENATTALSTITATSNTSTSVSDQTTSTVLTPTPSSTISTPTPSAIISSTLLPQTENESDSPLGDVKFLSFEEWKRQNLAQVGQSAEGLGEGRRPTAAGQDRNTPGHGNGLDTLGEESEIELDFSGFGGGVKPDVVEQSSSVPVAGQGKDAKETGGSSVRPRSRDAGKTGKERFNYASFDCAANVLKTNSRCKSSSSILMENKDRYMLNECSMNHKFIVVELCDDILIDTVVLANFEFFSSMFRTFRVSVSDRYPVKQEKWKELGTYEARNSRDIQAFWIENPLIWARYLKIEFLTHYGSEFYCPVSLLRVHGTTMMEEYRREERAGGADADDDDDVGEYSEVPSIEVKPVATAPSMTEKHEVLPAIDSTSGHLSTDISDSAKALTLPVSTPSSPSSQTSLSKLSSSESSNASASQATTAMHSTPRLNSSASMSNSFISASTHPQTDIRSKSASHSTSYAHLVSETSSTSHSEMTSAASSSTTSNKSDQTLPSKSSEDKKHGDASASMSPATTQPSSKPSSSPSSAASSNSTSTSIHRAPSSTPSSMHQQPQHPGTQESIFKSIHKRLTSLESNSTLSLAYIESQSQLILSTLTSISKNQQSRVASFLVTLNNTVSAELLAFKRDYDQLWQSTVLELAEQREEGRREREILGERVRILAEEMVGQKRIIAAQATALLVCAALLIFTRIGPGAGATGAVSDLSLARGMVGGGDSNAARQASDGSPAIVSPMKRTLGFSPSSPNSPRRRWKWDNALWPRSPSARPNDKAATPSSPSLSPPIRLTESKSEGEGEGDNEVESDGISKEHNDHQSSQPRRDRKRANRTGVLGGTTDTPDDMDTTSSTSSSQDNDTDIDPTPTAPRPSTAPGFVETTTSRFQDDHLNTYPSTLR